MCSFFTLFVFQGLQSRHKFLVSVLYFCFAIPLAPKEPLQYQEFFCTDYTHGNGEVKGMAVAFKF